MTCFYMLQVVFFFSAQVSEHLDGPTITRGFGLVRWYRKHGQIAQSDSPVTSDSGLPA